MTHHTHDMRFGFDSDTMNNWCANCGLIDNSKQAEKALEKPCVMSEEDAPRL